MRLKQYLTEKTFNINKDVDYIFNKYFKKLYVDIKNGKWNGQFNRKTFMSSDLPSKTSKQASELNPVKIIITESSLGNFYLSVEHYIQLSPNKNVLNMLRNYGNIKAAMDVVSKSQQIEFENETNGIKMKNSIYHELSHWLDDTLHNFHISNIIKKSKEVGVDLRTKSKNIPSINKTKTEINAQIHAIKQLKRVFSKKWDRLTFDEMIELDTSLKYVRDESRSPKELNDWKKDILKRMARENLLGKKMK